MTTPLLAVATGGKSLWYLTRGTGVVTLLFLTASVVLGIVTTVRWESRRWPRVITAGLHRNVSLMVLVFLVAHIATTVVDGFVPIGWLDAVVPFGGGYRPIWLGLGAVAFDLLIAVVVTSLLRERVGNRVWRVVHWAAYACWPLALVHGLGTGFDARQTWMLVLDGLSLVAVSAALMWRVAVSPTRVPAARLAAAAATCVLPLGIVVFAVVGPLDPNWQRPAQRPAVQVTDAAAAAGVTPTSASPSGAVGGITSGNASGSFVEQAAADGTATEVFDLWVGAGHVERLRITLTGRARPGGGLSGAHGRVDLGTAADRGRLSGAVTSIAGGRIVAALVHAAGGTRASVVVDLAIDRAAGAAQGPVQVTATAGG